MCCTIILFVSRARSYPIILYISINLYCEFVSHTLSHTVVSHLVYNGIGNNRQQVTHCCWQPSLIVAILSHLMTQCVTIMMMMSLPLFANQFPHSNHSDCVHVSHFHQMYATIFSVLCECVGIYLNRSIDLIESYLICHHMVWHGTPIKCHQFDNYQKNWIECIIWSIIMCSMLTIAIYCSFHWHSILMSNV